jgi:hypothetical protein
MNFDAEVRKAIGAYSLNTVSTEFLTPPVILSNDTNWIVATVSIYI